MNGSFFAIKFIFFVHSISNILTKFRSFSQTILIYLCRNSEFANNLYKINEFIWIKSELKDDLNSYFKCMTILVYFN